MNTLQLQKFEGVAKFLRALSKILFILCLVGGGLALIGALACLFIPSSTINELIGMLNSIDTTFKMGELSFHMSDFSFTAGSLKMIGVSGFLILVATVVATAYIFLQLRKILDNVVGKTPFAQTSIVSMKALSVAIIIYSLFTSIGGFISSQLMFRYFLGSAASLSGNFVDRIDFDLDFAFILVGFLVYLLAKIFEYGASLQNEVDELL